MQESFHSNLLDWGSSNALSVALGDTAYSWNPDSGATAAFYRTYIEPLQGPRTDTKQYMKDYLGSITRITLPWEQNTARYKCRI